MSNVSTVNWDEVSAVISAAALLINAIVAYSLVISIRAVREAQRTKESAIFIWALDKLIEIRPLMNEIRDGTDINIRGLQNKNKILKILEVIQMITFMAEEGIVSKQLIVSMWGKSFVEQWIFLEPFIREFRKNIGESEYIESGAYFARSFERFAQFARADLDKRFPVAWPSADFSVAIHNNG